LNDKEEAYSQNYLNNGFNLQGLGLEYAINFYLNLRNLNRLTQIKPKKYISEFIANILASASSNTTPPTRK
jgi:hypothetical protein